MWLDARLPRVVAVPKSMSQQQHWRHSSFHQRDRHQSQPHSLPQAPLPRLDDVVEVAQPSCRVRRQGRRSRSTNTTTAAATAESSNQTTKTKQDEEEREGRKGAGFTLVKLLALPSGLSLLYSTLPLLLLPTRAFLTPTTSSSTSLLCSTLSQSISSLVLLEEEEEQSSLVGWLRSIAKGEREAGRRRRRRS